MVKNIQKYRVIALISLLSFISCDKQEDFTPVFSSTIVELDDDTVRISASISADVELESQGLIYSQYSDLSMAQTGTYYYSNYDRGILDVDQLATQEYLLKDLVSSTTYYYRLFAVNDGAVKESEVLSFMTDCPGLGCGPAGGPIIWEDGMGGGIEAATSYTVDEVWGCDGTSASTDEIIGSGQANTTQIITDCGTNTLAQKCEDYSQNGFSDYYMPSKDEMALIYEEVFVKGGNPYNWAYTTYYSSTEYLSAAAWAISFSSGSWGTYSKSGSYYGTIPVRSF